MYACVCVCVYWVNARVWLLLGLHEINRTCSEEWDDGQWTQLRRQLWGGEEVEGGGRRGRREREGWEESSTLWRAKCPDSHRSHRVGPLQAWQMDRQGYAPLADSGSWCQCECSDTSVCTHKQPWRNGHILMHQKCNQRCKLRTKTYPNYFKKLTQINTLSFAKMCQRKTGSNLRSFVRGIEVNQVQRF